MGVISRHSASADTGYVSGDDLDFVGVDIRIQKRVAGTDTTLFTGSSGTDVQPQTIKMESDGSTQTCYIGGVSIATGTDTAITGNLRTGIKGSSTGALRMRWDNFEAADLVGAVQLERIERHYPRGHHRGVQRGTR